MTITNQGIRSVAVYCSASDLVHESFARSARELGEWLATSGRELIYGGGRVGLMGHTARACREAGGYTIGIITRRLAQLEQLDPDSNEMTVVETMRQRKALIEARADAMVVLPGGIGTLEEFFEILVGRILGEHDKPIYLLNLPDPGDRKGGRYFDPLLAMFDHMIAGRFARPSTMETFQVCESVPDLIGALDAWVPRPRSPEVRPAAEPFGAVQG